jgi:radical SAM protein with 4Fe4S-binding SPASM domain
MYKLEITTKIGCKNNCSICPQTTLINKYKQVSNEFMMSFDTFKTCIDKLPLNSKIHFSGMCECFLNPDCGKMLQYVLDKRIKIGLYTTLIGTSNSDINFIKNHRIDPLAFHLPNKAYMNINDEQVKEWCDKFSKILPYIGDRYLALSIKPLIDDYLINYLTNNKIKYTVSPLLSRAGILENSINIKGCISCNEDRFFQNVLLPNGDVILCCQDYGLKHRLGNLVTDEFYDLFKSNEFIKIRSAFRDDNIDIICRRCEKAVNI